MTDTQAELNIGIGNLESEKTFLKPAKVKIVSAKIEDTKKAKKVVFWVLHPDKPEQIGLSSIAYLQERSVKVSGTWLNLDKEGKLQKGSALVVLLQKIGANTIQEAVGKECETELDGQYLVFKAY